MTTLLGKDIDAINDALLKTPDKPDEHKAFSKKEALSKLAPTLLELRDKKGYDKPEIMTLLKDNGLEVSSYMYDQVMKGSKQPKSNSVKARTKKTIPGIVPDKKDL